jgi:hypothetical protein
MATNIAQTLANTIASAVVSATGSNATLKLYTGVAPANPDTAATGTLLATLAYSGAALTASANVITVSPNFTATAAQSGTVGYGRLSSSAGTAIIDFTDVGTSGASLNFASTSLTSGQSVSVTSGTITMPYP